MGNWWWEGDSTRGWGRVDIIFNDSVGLWALDAGGVGWREGDSRRDGGRVDKIFNEPVGLLAFDAWVAGGRKTRGGMGSELA